MLEVKKEALGFPKADPKVKTLKAKKVVLKGIHVATKKKKKDPHITHLPVAQDIMTPKAASVSSEEHYQEK